VRQRSNQRRPACFAVTAGNSSTYSVAGCSSDNRPCETKASWPGTQGKVAYTTRTDLQRSRPTRRTCRNQLDSGQQLLLLRLEVGGTDDSGVPQLGQLTELLDEHGEGRRVTRTIPNGRWRLLPHHIRCRDAEA
jgi:hypothetical protein